MVVPLGIAPRSGFLRQHRACYRASILVLHFWHICGGFGLRIRSIWICAYSPPSPSLRFQPACMPRCTAAATLTVMHRVLAVKRWKPHRRSVRWVAPLALRCFTSARVMAAASSGLSSTASSMVPWSTEWSRYRQICRLTNRLKWRVVSVTAAPLWQPQQPLLTRVEAHTKGPLDLFAAWVLLCSQSSL